MTTVRIAPASAVTGTLAVPGDKSISHRALILGVAVEGSVTIQGLSPAADVASTRSALQTLGLLGLLASTNAEAEPHLEPSSSLILEGIGSWTPADPCSLDCGNSGSTMRMLMGCLAQTPIEVELHGDASLSRRPMARIADPLRRMGSRIELAEGDRPPVRMVGGSLRGIEYRMPIASAQVKTALLLAGLQAEGVTTVIEPAPTRDHTERMLRHLGVDVGSGELRVTKTRLFGDRSIDITGDFSSASFLLTAAAILPGSDLTIQDVGLNPTRVTFLEILERFGAEVEVTPGETRSQEPRGSVRVRAARLRGADIGAELVPGAIDELPLVAVLGCYAQGETRLRGAEELRVKESDRIAAIGAGLSAMGARFDPRPDGFVVRPAPLAGARVDSHGDHRIAMALAVAALGASGPTTIEGWDAVGVSYPGFESALAAVAAR